MACCVVKDNEVLRTRYADLSSEHEIHLRGHRYARSHCPGLANCVYLHKSRRTTGCGPVTGSRIPVPGTAGRIPDASRARACDLGGRVVQYKPTTRGKWRANE